MLRKYPILYGLGGDSQMAPEHTHTAFWAALAGGASGFVSGVRLTKDEVVVCCEQDYLGTVTESEKRVDELTWDEIRKLDAGYRFRSITLDAENQPTSQRGSDTPWRGNIAKKKAIHIPRLDDVLTLFARRCEIIIQLSVPSEVLVEKTIALLVQYGAVDRVIILADDTVCKKIRQKNHHVRLALNMSNEWTLSEQVHSAAKLQVEAIYIDWNFACPEIEGEIKLRSDLKEVLKKNELNLLIGSKNMPYAPLKEYIQAIAPIKHLCGIISKGVLTTMSLITPPALVLSDDFKGQNIDREKWTAGYSHMNQDTEIYQKDGLNIEIHPDGSYSGAAAICLLPVHGRFDSQVDFHVSNPMQGTTFEMAAICIDPGYFHTDNSDLDTRNVNLTFDVHGAPPYASSERDEDDGFRCGWNNGFNLTKVAENWESSSVNMYNKYGRDVGNGLPDNPDGTLRLVRNGSVFATYYKDKYNETWVCSGIMLVQNMSDDVYIRLAAKHWNKGGKSVPGNHVTFHNFQLHQF